MQVSKIINNFICGSFLKEAIDVAVFVASPVFSITLGHAAQGGLSGNRADVRACYSIVTE